MVSEPIDTAAIRDRAGTSYNEWSDFEVEELCDEVDRLRAEVDRLTPKPKRFEINIDPREPEVCLKPHADDPDECDVCGYPGIRWDQR